MTFSFPNLPKLSLWDIACLHTGQNASDDKPTNETRHKLAEFVLAVRDQKLWVEFVEPGNDHGFITGLAGDGNRAAVDADWRKLDRVTVRREDWERYEHVQSDGSKHGTIDAAAQPALAHAGTVLLAEEPRNIITGGGEIWGEQETTTNLITELAAYWARRQPAPLFAGPGFSDEALKQTTLTRYLDFDTWTPAAAAMLVCGLQAPIDNGQLCTEIPAGHVKGLDGCWKSEQNCTAIADARRVLGIWRSQVNPPARVRPLDFIRWCQARGFDIAWLRSIKDAAGFSDETSHFSITEAAAELHMTEAVLLRACLDEQLELSIRFSGRNLPKAKLRRQVPFEVGYPRNRFKTASLGLYDRTVTLGIDRSLWTLVMAGSGRLCIEDEYLKAIGRTPAVSDSSPSSSLGIFVSTPDVSEPEPGYFMLYELQEYRGAASANEIRADEDFQSLCTFPAGSELVISKASMAAYKLNQPAAPATVDAAGAPAMARHNGPEPDRPEQAIPIESLFTELGFERNYQMLVAEPGSSPVKTAITSALIASATATSTPTSGASKTEIPEERQRRRLARFREMGANLERAGGGKWRLTGRHGVLSALSREEKAAGRARWDASDIRKELERASEAEYREQIGS